MDWIGFSLLCLSVIGFAPRWFHDSDRLKLCALSLAVAFMVFFRPAPWQPSPLAWLILWCFVWQLPAAFRPYASLCGLYASTLVIGTAFLFGGHPAFLSGGLVWLGAVVALDAILDACDLSVHGAFRTHFGSCRVIPERLTVRRPGGVLGNPDHLGTFCAALLPVALAAHNVPASLLLVVSLLLTYTRGAWLAIGWPLLSLCSAYLFSQHYKFLADDSVQARLRYWRHAWTLIKEHPWIGHGLGTFEVHVAPLHRETARLTHVHNEYLELWHDLGVVAMLLFPTIGGLAAWHLWHKGCVGLSIGLIVLLTDALWSPGLRSLPVQLLFWLFVGCALPAAAPLPFEWDAWRIGIAALLLALPNVGISLMMADYHFKAGLFAWRDNQLDTAISAFADSYLAAPGKLALYALGMVCTAAGRPDDAICFYEKTLTVDPYFAQAHANLGKLLILAGREGEGLLHLQEQEEIDDLMMVSPDEREVMLTLI